MVTGVFKVCLSGLFIGFQVGFKGEAVGRLGVQGYLFKWVGCRWSRCAVGGLGGERSRGRLLEKWSSKAAAA